MTSQDSALHATETWWLCTVEYIWGMLGWVADGENKLLAMKQKTSFSKDVRKRGWLFCLHIISISSPVLPLTRKPRVVSAICF